MNEYTFAVAFAGDESELHPGIDWSWWASAPVTIDPFGKKSNRTGLAPVKPKLSSNVLVAVRVELWTPTCGLKLPQIVDKIRYRAIPETSKAIAMGLKRPTDGTASQEGNFLMELSPGSQFTINREDRIKDEIRRYHIKWDSLFNRCRLITDVRMEPLAAIP